MTTVSDRHARVIDIYQKQWAFSDDPDALLRTGSFGPCYIVVFTAPGCAAMAHIDDNTHVNSIVNIFNRFTHKFIDRSDVNVLIAGGWKEHEESKKWGDDVLRIIREAGFKSVDTKRMYTKKTLKEEQITGLSNGTVSSKNLDQNDYYYVQLDVDPASGSIAIGTGASVKVLDDEQLVRTNKFVEENLWTPNKLYALEEVGVRD